MKKITLFVISVVLSFSLLTAVRPSFGQGIEELVSRQTGLSADEAKKQVQVVFSAIEEELQNGRSVTIRNFGKFYLRKRKPRQARNPKTGETFAFPERNYPRFSSSEKLKEAVNESNQATAQKNPGEG